MACFRDKVSPNRKELATLFIQTVKKEFPSVISLINTDIKTALETGAHGVHLTSNQKELIKECASLPLICGFSAHTLEDIEFAEVEGADFVTFSPIFNSPNKGKPLGLDILKSATDRFSIPIFALGGVDRESRIEALRACNVAGFASIRYFI